MPRPDRLDPPIPVSRQTGIEPSGAVISYRRRHLHRRRPGRAFTESVAAPFSTMSGLSPGVSADMSTVKVWSNAAV